MDVSTLRVLSLFSGAAGLDLGITLGNVALGRRTRIVGYVERDAYAQAVLVARAQEGALCDAPVWSDVATFDGRPWRGLVDCVAGGFPCQDISNAGKRAGIADGPGADSGTSSPGSSPRFDLDLSLLKTSRRSPPAGSTSSQHRLPKWGSMRSGVVTERATSAPLTSASACSSSHGEYPTPSASEYGTNQGGSAGRTGPVRPSLSTLARTAGEAWDETSDDDGDWPTTTTTTTDAKGSRRHGYMVEGNPGTTLTDAAIEFASTTPQADSSRRDGSTATPGKSGVGLDPRFCEALMGWPIEWTGLESLETESCLKWLRWHGLNSAAERVCGSDVRSEPAK